MLVIDDWNTVKGYCRSCKEIVDAWQVEDTETGARWLMCPDSKTHEVEDADVCQSKDCDAYVAPGECFCEWCLSELKVAVDSFKNALPYDMPYDTAVQEAIDRDWL